MIVNLAQLKPTARLAPFLVFEGINGCGKSTLINALATKFREENLPHITTKEPGGTPLGQVIRRLLLEHTAGKPSAQTEVFLFSTDRAEHVQTVILPAINRGQLVICDRSFYSTMAFQGYGRGQDLERISTLSEIAVGDTLPDLVILLDLDPQTALERKKTSREIAIDKFEEEELIFHKRVRDGFLQIAAQRKEQFLILDASQKIDAIQSQAFSAIKQLLNR